MNEQFVIVMLCYDADLPNPYQEEVTGIFGNEDKAKYEMLHCVIDELNTLCGITADDTFPELRFIPTMEDEEHDIVINAWDGPDYRPVTCYDVVSLEKHIHTLNKKLYEKYGEEIGVGITAHLDGNGSIHYHYDTTKGGESDRFSTATYAYYAAVDYCDWFLKEKAGKDSQTVNEQIEKLINVHGKTMLGKAAHDMYRNGASYEEICQHITMTILPKAIPTRPNLSKTGATICPNCNRFLDRHEQKHGNLDIPHCKWCGQAIDWKGVRGNGKQR